MSNNFDRKQNGKCGGKTCANSANYRHESNVGCLSLNNKNRFRRDGLENPEAAKEIEGPAFKNSNYAEPFSPRHRRNFSTSNRRQHDIPVHDFHGSNNQFGRSSEDTSFTKNRVYYNSDHSRNLTRGRGTNESINCRHRDYRSQSDTNSDWNTASGFAGNYVHTPSTMCSDAGFTSITHQQDASYSQNMHWKNADNNIRTGDSEDCFFKLRSDSESSRSYKPGGLADAGVEFGGWSEILKQMELNTLEKWRDCPAIQKNFYIEHPKIANMTPREVSDWRLKSNNIQVTDMNSGTPNSVPNPTLEFFHAFEHYPEILSELIKVGFKNPTPIQSQAWPILMQGQDLIGISQTGTGKTLAFLLPAFIHIDIQLVPREQRTGPSVLVLSPTRELAQQIKLEVDKYSYKGIRAVCVYGGGSRKQQVHQIEKGVEIIIATPGRLNDLIQSDIVNVHNVTYVVLDEADRMLDMGFEPQIMKIMIDINPDRQTVLTSATWPEGVRRIASKYMKNPMWINVGSYNLAAVHSVHQTIDIVAEGEKYDLLMDMIDGMQPDDKFMVFTTKKVKADHLSSDLSLRGVDCECMHGDKEQCDRESALIGFRSGDVRILIATDVASRGIDVEDISHVINYDFPRNIEEYVHRVGRTGRAGRNGSAVTFMTRDDWRHAQGLIDILEEADQTIPAELYNMAARFKDWKSKKDSEFGSTNGRRGGGRGQNRW